MEGRKRALIILAILSVSLLAQVQAAPTFWIEPQAPKEGGSLTIYYKDPNATEVHFSVCIGTICMNFPVDEGKESDGTWWARFDDLPAGDGEYTIKATYHNDETGNATHLEFSRPITVSTEEESTWIPMMAIYAMAGSLILVGVSYWAWRRHNGD